MTTVVVIPGAWLTPDFYQPFLVALNLAGYRTHLAGYPSLNPSNPATADCQADSDAIQRELRNLVEDQSQNVVLLMHSYAGMPGASAASGLSKVERQQQGKSGGILGLIFLAAFVVPEGHSCAGLQGGQLPSWILLDKPSAQLNIVDDPVGNFAPEVDQALLGDLNSYLKPHSSLAFFSPQPVPAWTDASYAGRLAFIITTADKAVPKEAQRWMITNTEKEFIVKEMECSHLAPFVDRIPETVGLVDDLLPVFQAK
ncbi:alpha/beta hydrolase [Aspergillus tubingensis]|uniref:alpha/beta hydrolase n=1 Tax=Aspergillus tubingensis TaxID=5068 RepID=UPI0015784152|nr:SHNi-TPR family protein [Aspergillus tubingensis]GFN11408.1 SHNi-TPR family protein [Aspergillus tubingensis]